MLDQNQQQNDNTTDLTGQSYVTSEPLGPNNPGIVVPQNPPQVTQPSIQNQPQVNTLTRSVPTVDVNPSPIVNASLPAPNQVAQPTPAIHPVMDANAPVTNQPSQPNQASHANTVPPGLQGIVNGSEIPANTNSLEDLKKSKKQKVFIGITATLACLLIIGGFFLYAFVLKEDKKPFLTKYEQMKKTISDPYHGSLGYGTNFMSITTNRSYTNEDKIKLESGLTSIEIANEQFAELEKEYKRYNAVKDKNFKNLAKTYTEEIRNCIDTLDIVINDYINNSAVFAEVGKAIADYQGLSIGEDRTPSLNAIVAAKEKLIQARLDYQTHEGYKISVLGALDKIIPMIESEIANRENFDYQKKIDDFWDALEETYKFKETFSADLIPKCESENTKHLDSYLQETKSESEKKKSSELLNPLE